MAQAGGVADDIINHHAALLIGIMQEKSRCQIPLPIRCRWRFGAVKFRCRRTRQIASKRLIKKYLHVERAPFSRAAKIFSPDVREKLPAQRRASKNATIRARCA